jgi:hypothetical protein
MSSGTPDMTDSNTNSRKGLGTPVKEQTIQFQTRIANEAFDVFAETGMSPRELATDRDGKSKRMWELGHECDRLQSERDSAVADARRYRWLKEHGVTLTNEGEQMGQIADLDTAIDRAIEAEKRGGE